MQVRKTEDKVVSDFKKAFSCSYSVTKNLGEALGLEADDLLLRAVVGLGAGVSTMGDTCGAVNSGVILLGKRFPRMPALDFNLLCAEYSRRLARALETPSCGQIHGGRHLTKDFRRAVLTGTSRKCARILKDNTALLATLIREAEARDASFLKGDGLAAIKRITAHYEEHSFHCCQVPVRRIGGQFALEFTHILDASRGFCGGIGFDGTLCGALMAGVLCLGLKASVDLSKSGYLDTVRVVLHGLLKSDGIFHDEKRFRPARLFGWCQELYLGIESRFGGAHCRDVLGLRLDTADGVRQYIQEGRIQTCEEIVEAVVAQVRPILS